MKLMRDIVGATLGERYRIVARIAGGGMGEVFRAHDLLLDRPVAVKVLHPSLASEPDLVARFRAEARAAGRLNHPNVVAVHDWGSEDERTYYMVMEYVSGRDLRDLIVGGGPMDPARACQIAASICDALQVAHTQGLVHRDVKPENVLIARDGTVKVADFGIAGIADAESFTLTGAGLLGTLRYLSPEQAEGHRATSRSDIWAVGAVLYELLTGTTPQGGTGAELLRRRASEAISPPSALEPEIPAELDDIVVRACALSPDERFIDAASMGSALRAVAADLPSPEASVAALFTEMTDEVRLPDMDATGFVGRGARLVERKRKARVRVGRLLGVTLLAAALLFGGVKAFGAVFGPKEVDVPKLVGLSEDGALERAEEMGLEIDVVGRERHPDLEEGRVIRQDPANGVLLEGKAIRIVISKGPPLVKIPALVGLPLEDAEAELRSAGLTLGAVTEEHSIEHDEGSVIEIAGRKKVEEGTAVAVTVSKGPQTLSVPDVVGMNATKATKTLEAAGFEVERVDVYSDDVDEGFVVSTDPASGSDAPEASTISMAVSIGPEFKEITMPDVRNMHVDEARSVLEGQGLVVQVHKSCPGTTVIETDPTQGSKILEGSTVRLWVCG